MHSPQSWEQTLGVARPHGVALLGELTCVLDALHGVTLPSNKRQ
jgi:hypothetical protein